MAIAAMQGPSATAFCLPLATHGATRPGGGRVMWVVSTNSCRATQRDEGPDQIVIRHVPVALARGTACHSPDDHSHTLVLT
jgi:hypothetical protein